MSDKPLFQPVSVDEPGGPKRGSWLLEQWKEFVAAARFLSTVPIPGSTQLFRTDTTDTRLFLGSAYFPLIGLLLAVILWLIVWMLGLFVSSLVLAALLVVSLILLTGGLHLDGLMDTCDGIFGGTTRARKLEIMRDSRVGSFGVLGGICILLLKFSLYASLDLHTLPFVLFTILPISRWTMVQAMYVFPSARPTGLGAAFRQTVTQQRFLCAALFAILIALFAGHLIGLLLWVCATVLTWLVGQWVTRTLGGLTGDSYGTLAELTEVVLLLIFMLLHFWL